MLMVLLCLSTLAAMILFVRTWLVLQRHKDWSADIDASSDLPTVSVCIAARNETHALAQCLERVLKSDYKKLEILVLDDSSTDDTSLIIKSFASAGVRFIAGTPLPEGWLGKNHAYQTLITEASGDLLLFIDVDTHISESTVASLVAKLHKGSLAMLSVLPRRFDGIRVSAALGTMRYYWELLLGTDAGPPAASALWMVNANALKQTGIGLQNYSMSVRPERHLARQLQRTIGYRYIIGTATMGVSYEKHIQSQHETAIRLYYPATGRNTVAWVLCSVYLLLLIAPLPIVLLAPMSQIMQIWATLLIMIIAAGFAMFVVRTYGTSLWALRIALGPLLIIQEVVLLALSYIRYRHSTVTWKGRLINAQPERTDALTINE